MYSLTRERDAIQCRHSSQQQCVTAKNNSSYHCAPAITASFLCDISSFFFSPIALSVSPWKANPFFRFMRHIMRVWLPGTAWRIIRNLCGRRKGRRIFFNYISKSKYFVHVLRNLRVWFIKKHNMKNTIR